LDTELTARRNSNQCFGDLRSPVGMSPVWNLTNSDDEAEVCHSPIIKEENNMKCRSCGWTNTVFSNWTLRIFSQCEKCNESLYCQEQRLYKMARQILLGKRVLRRFRQTIMQRKRQLKQRNVTIVSIQS